MFQVNWVETNKGSVSWGVWKSRSELFVPPTLAVLCFSRSFFFPDKCPSGCSTVSKFLPPLELAQARSCVPTVMPVLISLVENQRLSTLGHKYGERASGSSLAKSIRVQWGNISSSCFWTNCSKNSFMLVLYLWGFSSSWWWPGHAVWWAAFRSSGLVWRHHMVALKNSIVWKG